MRAITYCIIIYETELTNIDQSNKVKSRVIDVAVTVTCNQHWNKIEILYNGKL